MEHYDVAEPELEELDFDFCKYSVSKHMRTRSFIRDPRWPLFLKALQ
ncbi:hypothetical protein ACVINW_004037 [Bradyrhizobium sp. USDA 4461]